LDIKNIKHQIRRNFSNAAEQYSGWARVQEQSASMLAAMLPGVKAETVLDIGCGTGFLTGKVMAKLKPEKLTGLDFAEGMTRLCAQQWPGSKFLCVDAEEYDPGEQFSVVVSNFTFQWLGDLPKAMKAFYSWVKPGGFFAFCVPVKGSLKELSGLSGAFYDFPDETGFLMPLPKPVVRLVEDMTVYYDSPVEAVKSLKKIGANYKEGAGSGKKLTRAGLKEYGRLYKDSTGKYPVTYRVLTVVVKKRKAK
jgi:malonyl-CoA O-methyltransferase